MPRHDEAWWSRTHCPLLITYWIVNTHRYVMNDISVLYLQFIIDTTTVAFCASVTMWKDRNCLHWRTTYRFLLRNYIHDGWHIWQTFIRIGRQSSDSWRRCCYRWCWCIRPVCCLLHPEERHRHSIGCTRSYRWTAVSTVSISLIKIG